MAITNNRNCIEVSGVTIAAKTLLTDQNGAIKHVIWNGGTTSGHKASLVDTIGNVLWKADITAIPYGTPASGNGYGGQSRVADLNLNIPFQGLMCDDLDSGSLLIYFSDLR
jgi:hypothetical protein